MKSRPLLVFTAIVFLGALFLCVACNRHDYGRKDPIRIGMVVDQTGALALYGKWALNGATMAVNELNESDEPGSRQVELLVQDSLSQSQGAVSAARYLIEIKKVPAIIVATGTGSLMAVAPICNRGEVVLFGTLASGPIVTTAGDFVFRNRVSGVEEVIGIASWALGRGIDNVGLALLDNEAGRSYEQAFQEIFKALSGAVSIVEWLEPGGADYRAQVLKISRTPELNGVFFGANVKEIGIFIKQAAELGFTTQWMAMTSVESDQIFSLAGDKADGLVYAAEAYDQENEKTAAFDSAYRDRFGEASQNYSANNYDAVMTISNAIAQGTNSGISIRDYLYALHDYHGVSGLMSFDVNGDVEKSIAIKIIKNGKFLILNGKEEENEDANFID